MEGRTRHNRLTREQAIRVVLWIERNRETLRLHQATVAKAAEMATDALPMQRRDDQAERIQITASTIRKMLQADPSLNWQTVEPIGTDCALRIIARNLLRVMQLTDCPATIDVVQMATDEVDIVPQPHKHAAEGLYYKSTDDVPDIDEQANDNGNGNGQTQTLFQETEG